MTQNWMRHFELQLVDGNGQGIELSDFKVTFTIDWFNISSASRVGTIKIYNLSADTVNRITGQEFSKVRLIAGYDGIAPEVSASDVGTVREVDAADVGQSDGRNYGLIFSGEIRYSVTGKDSPVDSYVLIQAADTDLAFATSITSQTLAAGYTVADVNRALMKDFEAKGATEGLTPEMPATVFPRGRVLFGMTRHLMDNVAGQCGATWQFVDGQRQMVANNEYVHDAIVLSSATGLIGMPQQTIGNGVNVRALINPNIRVNGLIQLDQASVFRTALSNNDIAIRRADHRPEHGRKYHAQRHHIAACQHRNGWRLYCARDYVQWRYKGPGVVHGYDVRSAWRGGSVYAIGFAKGMSNEGYYFSVSCLFCVQRVGGWLHG